MASLFNKLRTAVLAAAHKLADAAIDLNSGDAVKVHVRDLEEALEQLQDAAASETGNVRSVQRDLAALDARAVELDGIITFLLTDDDTSNDQRAVPLQARLDAMQGQIASKREELAASRATEAQLQQAASTLAAKHASMVERVRSLESMERATEAKERAAGAIKAAGAVVAGGDGVSVDDVERRLHQRTAVADAKFDRAMGAFAGGVEKDVALAQANAAIAKRKAAIAAQQAAAQAKPAGEPSASSAEATPAP